MYNGSIINEIPTMSFQVKEDLKGAAFTAVALVDGGIISATDSDISIGILIAEHELPITADKIDKQVLKLAIEIEENYGDPLTAEILRRRYIAGENYVKTHMALFIAQSTYYKKLRSWRYFIEKCKPSPLL